VDTKPLFTGYNFVQSDHPADTIARLIRRIQSYEIKQSHGFQLALVHWNEEDLGELLYMLGRANAQFLKKEFLQWISDEAINPGRAFMEEPERWSPHLVCGKFTYTYNERLRGNLRELIKLLREQQDTRRAFLPIWRNEDRMRAAGPTDVPCVIGFHFQVTEGYLNLTTIMRSLDIINCLPNDVYLSIRLLEYVAREVDIKIGIFLLWSSNAHIKKGGLRG